MNTWNDKKEWDAYAHARNLTTIPIYEIAGNHDTGSMRETITGILYRIFPVREPAENYVTSVGDFDFVGINYAATDPSTGGTLPSPGNT